MSRRRLVNALTFVSALLLAGVVALWVRGERASDTFILRTSPWYVGGPRLKFVTLETYDGLVVSFTARVVPGVVAPAPAWRLDVPFAATAPAADFYGNVRVWRVMPPLWPGTRPMSDDERRAYVGEVGAAYRDTPVLRTFTGPTSRRVLVGSAPTLLLLVGVRSSGGDEYLTDHSLYPGAYRVVRLRAPFALAALVFGALPLARAPRWLWRRVLRRRWRRVGLCAGCGYDLRASRDRCPECGRPIETFRLAGPAPDDPPAPATRAPPSRRGAVALATFAAAAACAAWVLVPGSPRGGPARAGPDPLLTERARALVDSAPTAVIPRTWQRSVWLPEPGLADALRSTPQWVAREEPYPATLDPATGAIYVPGQGGLVRWNPSPPRRTTIAYAPRLPPPLGVAGLAFDRRRHRLMMLGVTAGGMTVYFYSPETGNWAAPATLPGESPDSVAYSQADDCFYALSRVPVGRSQGHAITRIDAETGQPLWRIPVGERVGGPSDFPVGSFRPEQPQLASVGPFLAIVTPPVPGSTRPRGGSQQRFVVINPATGKVVYSGPVP